MTRAVGAALAMATAITMTAGAPTACTSAEDTAPAGDGGSLDDGPAGSVRDDCNDGFPSANDPCLHEGSTCGEETAGPCYAAAIYTCHDGHLVKTGVSQPPLSCSSRCSDHRTGDGCPPGAMCTPSDGVTCFCPAYTWTCGGTLDAGLDATDADADADADADGG